MSIGRPLEFDPEIALKSAMALFWHKGYESTSLQDLIAAMKLSKSSFYQTFKSKRVLFLSCLDYYRKMLTEQLNRQLNEANSGRHFIESVFENIANEANGSTVPKGCLLMNTASEFSQSDPVIAEMLCSSIESLTTIFKHAIEQSQLKGEINPDRDSASLARYLVSSISGLRNMIKAGTERHQVGQIIELTLSVLD